jgi:hypothetical protein
MLIDPTTSYDQTCHKVDVTIDNYQMQSSMYATTIDDVDIVLESQWLATMCTIDF